MKTWYMISIACAVMVAGTLAFAQPEVPAAPEVPEVEGGTEVENPVQPEVPTAPEQPAASGNSCACPATRCDNGEVPGCQVSCPGQQVPECSCNGFCDSDGNPKGRNLCRCQ